MITRGEQIAELAPSFHDRRVPAGHETTPHQPLAELTRRNWRELARGLPADLTGWTALDVGCGTGFYTFELAQRGASVLGVDVDEHCLARARRAARELGLEKRVRFERLQVYELARLEERFDLVLFLGGVNHLRHPLLALDILAAKTTQLFVLQTMTVPGEDTVQTPVDLLTDDSETMLQLGWPKLAFVETRLAGDSTNWWTPNHACVMAMLRSAGLGILTRPGDGLYVCSPLRAADAVLRELDDATRF